jgi:hypothetical protein
MRLARQLVRQIQQHAMAKPMVRASGPLPLQVWELQRWRGGLAVTVNK